jgi:hypothetical protein
MLVQHIVIAKNVPYDASSYTPQVRTVVGIRNFDDLRN